MNTVDYGALPPRDARFRHLALEERVLERVADVVVGWRRSGGGASPFRHLGVR
jgi:hypothetical protein